MSNKITTIQSLFDQDEYIVYNGTNEMLGTIQITTAGVKCTAVVKRSNGFSSRSATFSTKLALTRLAELTQELYNNLK